MRCDDVDWPKVTTTRVERGWDDVEGEIGTKSKKGRRVVPIGADLRRYLLAHKLRFRRDGQELLFGPFRPQGMQKRADGAWAAAAVGAFIRGESLTRPLERLTLHDCRHTYVSMMCAAGCSLAEIGDFVGHSSAYMVDRYRHLLSGQRERAVARQDAFLAGANAGAERRNPAWLSRKPAVS